MNQTPRDDSDVVFVEIYTTLTRADADIFDLELEKQPERSSGVVTGLFLTVEERLDQELKAKCEGCWIRYTVSGGLDCTIFSKYIVCG